MSAYLMVSLHADVLNVLGGLNGNDSASLVVPKFSTHDWWDKGKGWKNLLNNLRLVLQPFVLFNLIRPWLKVFPIPQLSVGFPRLISLMNQLQGAVPATALEEHFHFSSA